MGRRQHKSKRLIEARAAVKKWEKKAIAEAAEKAASLGSIVWGAAGPLPMGVAVVRPEPVPQELLDEVERATPGARKRKREAEARRREEGGGDGGTGTRAGVVGVPLSEDEIAALRARAEAVKVSMETPAPILMHRIVGAMEKRARDSEVTLEDLEEELGIPIRADTRLMDMFPNNPRLAFKPVAQTLMYVAETDVRTAQDLILLLKESRPLPIPRKEFKRAFKGVQRVINKAIEKRMIIEIPPPTGSKQGPLLYHVGEKVDFPQEFVDTYRSIHLPEEAKIQEILEQNNLQAMTAGESKANAHLDAATTSATPATTSTSTSSVRPLKRSKH